MLCEWYAHDGGGVIKYDLWTSENSILLQRACMGRVKCYWLVLKLYSYKVELKAVLSRSMLYLKLWRLERPLNQEV